MSDAIFSKARRKYRFDEMAVLINDRIDDPREASEHYYVGLEHLDSDSLTIRRWGSPSDVEATKLRFRKGDILFGRRRVYQRKLAVADFDGICSAHAMVLRARPEVVFPGFLPFFMQSDLFMERALEISVGSLSPTINWRTLAQEEFALPTLAEQVRISALLAASERLRESITHVLAAAETMRAALITYWILGIHASSNPTELTQGGLSPGWRLLRASELSADLITKGETPSSELTDVDTGIPFLKVYNLTFDGRLDFSISPTYLTPRGHSQLQRSKVRPGDVLMNIVGPPLGKVAQVPKDFRECNINQAIARFRPVQNGLGDWLTAYLLSPLAQSWLLARSKKTSGQRNLTLETCRDLPVPVPPESAMRDIAGQLSQLELTAQRIRERSDQARVLGRRLLAAVLEVGDVH